MSEFSVGSLYSDLNLEHCEAYLEVDSPLELFSSCRSGLGAKSDPMPEEPRDDTCLPLALVGGAAAVAAAPVGVPAAAAAPLGVPAPPTMSALRQRRNSMAVRLPLDRCTVS